MIHQSSVGTGWVGNHHQQNVMLRREPQTLTLRNNRIADRCGCIAWAVNVEKSISQSNNKTNKGTPDLGVPLWRRIVSTRPER